MSRIDEIKHALRQDPEAVLEFMSKWMLDREVKDRKQGEFREEIQGYVNRSKTLERELKEKAEAFEDGTNEVLQLLQKQMQMLHIGLNRLEGRVNAIWNTMNTHIEFFKELSLEKWDMVEKLFVERFMLVGRRMFKEATEHQMSEMKRIKAQQRAGQQPTPMQQQPNPTMGTLLSLELAEKVDKFRAEVDEFHNEGEKDDAVRKG